MAQPTVDSRPATWAGTSAPILYKFTSTNYSNAGYYMAVEIWNSTTAAKIADAKYYSNSTGAVVVDVAPFLKSAMTLDNESDLTTGTVYTDGNWVKYYIKYREYWTASSESQVNDSSNLRYAVYGGVQLGTANEFTVPQISLAGGFLHLTDRGKAAKGYPYLVSHIAYDIANGIKKEYYLNGASQGTEISLTPTDSVVFTRVQNSTYDRVDLTVVETGDPILAPSAWSDTGANAWISRTATAFTIQSNSAGTRNYAAECPLDVPNATLVEFDITVVRTGAWVSNPSYVVSLLNSGGTVSGTQSFNTTGSGTYHISITSTDVITDIRFQVGTATQPGASNYETITWPVGQSFQVDNALTTPFRIDIEECSNTVMLIWRSSLGGWECFPFTINQEYTWHYSDRKAKRLTLYADNLTLSQWEAIQGLNTLGDLYRSPITEMTTSLNRTSATIGQSVYVLNSDGSKIGVNVIGQANTTQTKQKTHSAFVTIEYPELFLQ